MGHDGEFERARQSAEERRLVAAAAQGSSVAFEQLYRRHAGKVFGLCLRMTGHRETAEDCVQEAFVQAWRNLPRFEARSGFGTWLHRIAVNAVLAQARRRSERVGAEASVEEQIAESVADGEVGDFGADLDVEAAIASLPPGARNVLVLAGVYGYSHEETASMLGVAVGTCKAQLHRARQLLGRRLAAEEDAT
ncbi:MAG: sigma-70 family RNA polymerase sigma factor [Vicinamibacterales bacterium]|nr:sigma-70 family RNA polymerase sigma factor [Vicinamibacterales bacterium]